MSDKGAAKPRPVRCESQVLGLAMHPERSLAITGEVSGVVKVWDYAKEGRNIEKQLVERKADSTSGSCRLVSRFETGPIALGYSSGMLCAVNENLETTWEMKEAHESGLSSLLWLDNDLIATGDEDGRVKLWDTRTKGTALSTNTAQHGFISDLLCSKAKATLLAASGDGSLGVYSLRANKAEAVHITDEQDDDQLCLETVCDEKKIVVGSSNGYLDIWKFNVDDFDAAGDRFLGHPDSVTSLLKLDEHVLCTGSTDGVLRIVNFSPNKLLGVLTDYRVPIEKMCWSSDRKLIATTSHDERVRFWDASILFDDEDDDEEEDGEEEEDEGEGSGNEADKKKKRDDDDGGDDDDDDDGDDSDSDTDKGGKRTLDQKLEEKKRKKVEDFFSDL